MENWYVIQTKPRKEDEVCRRLQMASLETFNPRIKSFASGSKPLFPNYIFLKWNLSKAHNYHMIKYTRGVNKILGAPEYAVPISDDVIDVIRERIDPKNILEQQTLKTGSKVKIKKGLLKDLVAVLEKPVSADGRVAVLLRIYEREMRAMLDCKDVALVA